jgi:predicted RNA binding protein YcfA (HicA-like mRNA interferase family)
MSRKLKRLSGAAIVAILETFGFAPVSQRGSHVKLRRINADGQRQTLVVPLHDELDRGTLQAILRQASAYVPREFLEPHFYNE